MAGISETDLPYLARECPDLKDQQLVGGRFKYRAGAGRGGKKPGRAMRVRWGKKVIRYRKHENGVRIFRSPKHMELWKITRYLKKYRKGAQHRRMLKRNKMYTTYRYHGPGYRTVRRKG